jgi:phenylacetic acid degradation operon negative regulatory protein
LNSARGLLLTLLGEFVLPDGARAWTSQLIGGLRTLGVEEKAARQAISRTAARGLLEPERVGRASCWHLTDAGRKLLTEGSHRIYGFGQEHGEWDGEWVLVFASIPEARRQLRYHLRARMGWAGFAPFSGAWISPWASREEEAWQVLSDLDVVDAASSFVGRFGPFGDARSVAQKAWDLGNVQSEYAMFIRQFRRMRPVSPQSQFVAATRLVHEWRRFPGIDPGLPQDLLPAEWDGWRAADLFRDRRATWGPAARQWWAATA